MDEVKYVSTQTHSPKPLHYITYYQSMYIISNNKTFDDEIRSKFAHPIDIREFVLTEMMNLACHFYPVDIPVRNFQYVLWMQLSSTQTGSNVSLIVRKQKSKIYRVGLSISI